MSGEVGMDIYSKKMEKEKNTKTSEDAVSSSCSEKEQSAFRAGWAEGIFFMKNYGSLLGDDVKAIKKQIDEDWHNYNNR